MEYSITLRLLVNAKKHKHDHFIVLYLIVGWEKTPNPSLVPKSLCFSSAPCPAPF